MTVAPAMPTASTARLWAEFALLYLGAPFALWLFLPSLNLFAAIGAVTVVGLILLHQTPGFRWRELWDVGRLRETWKTVAALSLVTAAIVFPLAWWLVPERFLGMLRSDPAFLGLIWLLYPWFSVLGQEILYRPLFFRRYGHLFGSETTIILVNALVFGLAHGFFERWITFVMTLGGGLIFAWIYARTRSFSAVFILHWIAGGLIFTSGLGIYFYHGAIGR